MSDIDWKILTPTLESEEELRKKIAISMVVASSTVFISLLFYFKKYFTPAFFISKPFLGLFTLSSFLLAYMCIEPFMVQYTYKQIYIPKRYFQPFVAVHLSDLHLQWPYPYVTEESLTEIVQNVNNINPDFVFLTGDYISRFYTSQISAANTAAIRNALSGLRAKIGCYAILGNNDLRALDYVVKAFDSLDNIKLLRNESIKVNDILISGIDPSNSMEQAKKRLDYLKLEDSSLKILLSHEPDVAKVSSNYGFDLQLSGHSHGGQCVAPFGIGPLIVPTMGWRFPLGLYKVKNMLLFVSAGIGISPLPKPPVRFNNRPEVAVLRIVPSL